VIPRLRRSVKGLFGLLMLDDGMNLTYRRGTILVCAPLAEAGRLLSNRDHVIGINERDDGIEVVCREANLVFGEWVLDARSSEFRSVTTGFFGANTVRYTLSSSHRSPT